MADGDWDGVEEEVASVRATLLALNEDQRKAVATVATAVVFAFMAKDKGLPVDKDSALMCAVVDMRVAAQRDPLDAIALATVQ